MDTPSTWRGYCSRYKRFPGHQKVLGKSRARGNSTAQAHQRALCAGARRLRTIPSESGPASAMEQRLAEFRKARKQAGLLAQPSTSSESEPTSGAKAEPAAATPKTAPGWLRRFLKWKAGPDVAPVGPNQAQVRREAGTLKLRLRVRATPHSVQAAPTISGPHSLCLTCALSPRLCSGWTPPFLSVSAHDTWP